MPRRRREVRVPGGLRVVVRVHVDEAGRRPAVPRRRSHDAPGRHRRRPRRSRRRRSPRRRRGPEPRNRRPRARLGSPRRACGQRTRRSAVRCGGRPRYVAGMDEPELRTVDVVRTAPYRFTATNARGGQIAVGPASDDDFTPVELLLTALATCGAIDLDLVTRKRSEPDSFSIRVTANKIRDELGNRLVDIAGDVRRPVPRRRRRRRGTRGGPAHDPTDPRAAVHGESHGRGRHARHVRLTVDGRLSRVDLADPGPQLLVIRHGQTEWSKVGKHTGRTDIPLTDRGREEARHAGSTLHGWNIAHAYTSPLARAVRPPSWSRRHAVW